MKPTHVITRTIRYTVARITAGELVRRDLMARFMADENDDPEQSPFYLQWLRGNKKVFLVLDEEETRHVEKADPNMLGCVEGAEACAAAIRARGEK